MHQGTRILAVIALAAGLLMTESAPAPAFDWIGKIELDAEGLRSTDPSVRLQSATRLGQYDIDIVKVYLLAALRDTDARVRDAAGRILAKHKVAKAAPIVIEWLNDPDSNTKKSATDILAQIGTKKAVAALIRTLGDLDPEVRHRAVDALGRIGTPSVVVPLVGRLEDDKAEVRRAAIKALKKIGDRRAVIPMVGVFNDPSVEVRAAAAGAVGNLGDAAAVPALLRMLDSQVEKIRLAAVTSLGNLGAVEAVDPLIERFQRHSPRANVRNRIAEALARVGAAGASTDNATTKTLRRRAIDALVAALASDAQQTAATEALRVAGKAAVPSLIAHLQGQIDGDPATAVELLRDAGDPRATDALIAELERGRISHGLILDALHKSGDQRALKPILGLMSSKDASIRLRAMTAMRRLIRPNARAADVVVRLLDDENFEIRVLATEYLGLMRSKGAVTKLVRLAGPHNELRMRTAAVEALGEIGDPRASTTLLTILEKGPSELATLAANGLIYIADPKTINPLLAMMRGHLMRPRHQVVRVLGGVLRDRKHDAARKELERLASTDRTEVLLSALASLGAMGDRASLPLLTRLARSFDPHRRRAAVQAIGNLGDSSATPVLLLALRSRDDRVSAEAAWSLGKVGDSTAVEPLMRATRGHGWATSINASAALARKPRASQTAAFRQMLYHRIRFVRANAAEALGRLKAVKAQKTLTIVLRKDASWTVRLAAARALSRLPKSEIRDEALRAAAESDPDDRVREAAKVLLAVPFVPAARDDWRNFNFVDPDNGDAPVRQEPYFMAGADGLTTAVYTDERGEAAEEQFPAGPSEIGSKSRATQY